MGSFATFSWSEGNRQPLCFQIKRNNEEIIEKQKARSVGPGLSIRFLVPMTMRSLPPHQNLYSPDLSHTYNFLFNFSLDVNQAFVNTDSNDDTFGGVLFKGGIHRTIFCRIRKCFYGLG